MDDQFPSNPDKHDVAKVDGLWYRWTGVNWTPDTFAHILAKLEEDRIRLTLERMEKRS